jgi:hypothetical protein
MWARLQECPLSARQLAVRDSANAGGSGHLSSRVDDVSSQVDNVCYALSNC